MSDSISSFFGNKDFCNPNFSSLPTSPDDLFSIFDALEGLKEAATTGSGVVEEDAMTRSGLLSFQDLSETELDALEAELVDNNEDQPKIKRAKIVSLEERETEQVGDEGNKISHINVERNRRKQMNEHLSVLRSLMPCFYVKRGDQASIIGGVVDYISELQQLLQALEAKKQRKVYNEVLSPRVVSSPRVSPQVLSPRKPPLSPRINLPISPRTPQPGSPYRPRINIDLSPSNSSSIASSPLSDCVSNELVANSRSPMAEVEVKFSGPNLLLKTVSPRIPGQVVKIISTLEDLFLEILHINIITIEDTMLNSFTIKIGIECQLSAEELAHQIQQTFCSTTPTY